MRIGSAGRARVWVLLFLALAAAAAVFGYRDYAAFRDAPLNIAPGVEALDVPRGTSLKGIVTDLGRRNATTASVWYWRALAWQLGASKRLHAGEYALDPGLTPRELLLRMVRGEVIQHEFTIVPGWTFRELRDALAGEPLLQATLAGLSDHDVMARLGAPAVEPEGRFLPETYAFVKRQTDLELLRRAYEAMARELERRWQARDPESKLESPDQALVLASIVEKETGRADERPRIAGVFVRRLALGMKLQTDPTVIYGLGATFDGNLTREQLERDTPYNTYTRTGLPPTPIALPGKEALQAALHPEPGKALYFVAKGDGSHAFSDTLSEHNAAVSRYQLHR